MVILHLIMDILFLSVAIMHSLFIDVLYFLHNFMFMVVLFLLSPVILHLFMDTLDLFVVFCGGLMDLCSP